MGLCKCDIDCSEVEKRQVLQAIQSYVYSDTINIIEVSTRLQPMGTGILPLPIMIPQYRISFECLCEEYKLVKRIAEEAKAKAYARWMNTEKGEKDMERQISENEHNKIIITTDGTTTTARLMMGKEMMAMGTAKRNPIDEHNFITGVELAYKRLCADIETLGAQEGDTVIIIKPQHCYLTAAQWLEQYAPEYKVQYVYGVQPSAGNRYKIVKIAKHPTRDFRLYLIQSEELKGCYLVTREAFEITNKAILR